MFSFNPTDTDTNPNQESNPFKRLTATIFSYDGNVMLAALISLLLVILFVLLLHVYAKWFLSQAYHRRRRGSIAGVSRRVLGPTTSRLQHFHTFTLDPTTNSLTTPNNKGLDLATISAIPLSVFKSQQDCHKECVICLSLFEDEEVGRQLPKCGHCFHVECIDMWLHSHISCPICRAPVDQAKTETSSQLVIEVTESAEEAVVVMEVSDSGYETHHDFVAESSGDSVTDEPSSSPLMVGCSLKRMLSRNRTEGKVFPSSNGNDASV